MGATRVTRITAAKKVAEIVTQHASSCPSAPRIAKSSGNNLPLQSKPSSAYYFEGSIGVRISSRRFFYIS